MTQFNRREWLTTGAAAAVAAAAMNGVQQAPAAEERAFRGRINQSVVQWCFASHWKLEETCKISKQLGAKSVELVPASDWGVLKKHGLTCALAPSHLFVQGMNTKRYQKQCIEMMRKSIDDCVDAGFPTVITFTGFSQETGEWADGGIPDFSKLGDAPRRTIDPDEGLKTCVEGFKEIVGYAEKKKINISLEMLNSRVNVEMKGHPGYQGDHVDYCMDIINQVGSPRFGLLFDIYHVQIMDGDIITRIHECGEAINHVHTAGNPGRREIDVDQEINYAPCMKALLDINYKGYVGQEFIPTRDPLAGLKQAVEVCDV